MSEHIDTCPNISGNIQVILIKLLRSFLAFYIITSVFTRKYNGREVDNNAILFILNQINIHNAKTRN